MIIEYLKANGYDGLCNGDCGCRINDLIPCDQADNCDNQLDLFLTFLLHVLNVLSTPISWRVHFIGAF